jgi:TolB-like protein
LALLEYFLSNPGRVLDKDSLTDAIWPTVTVSDDSIAQCVSELRRRLGPSAARIRTVPRRGYIFMSDGIDTGRPPTPAASAAEAAQPSILVLPFVTFDPDDRIVDGLAEQISAGLGRFKQIFVIAHDSARALRRTGIDDFGAARALGVRYMVIGTARRGGDRLRVAARLVEVATGAELWADHVDSHVADVFALQDRVSQSILGALAPRLQMAEIDRIRHKPPGSLLAYDLCLAAHAAIRRMTRDGNQLALDHAAHALELEPDYGLAAGLSAWAYTLRVAHGWREDAEAERGRGVHLARVAIACGGRDGDAEALAMGGYALGFLNGELENGLMAIEEGIQINRCYARAQVFAGWLLVYLGQAGQAIDRFQTAMQLSPRDPELFRLQTGLAYAHFITGDYSEAIVAGRAALQSHPEFTPVHRVLASALSLSGRIDEAAVIVGDLHRLVPAMTVRSYLAQSPFHRSGVIDQIVRGLRLAGLPE